MCLSGGLVAAARSHIDWYPVAPAALLISQIRSGDVPTAEVASTIRIGPSLVFERLWHELGLPEILKEILSNRRARRCRQLPKHDSLHKTLLAARQE